MLNEAIQVEEIEECFLCRSKGTPLYRGLRDLCFNVPGLWSLLRCPGDGLVWLNPRPTVNDIGRVYPPTYFTHTVSEEQPRRRLAALRRKIRCGLLGTAFGYRELLNGPVVTWLGRVSSLFPPFKEFVGAPIMYLKGTHRGKLLDVGCGSGEFLVKMRELGWDVLGVEPDPEAARVTRERFGLPVIVAPLEEAGLLNNSFDAITMHHVIEHVHDPIAILRECARLLKPGGKLVVITPNIASLGHQLFQTAWYGLDPPRHLNLFSPRTLHTCSERAGLKIARLDTRAFLAKGVWYGSRLIQRDGVRPGGSPTGISFGLQLEGLAFRLIESALHPFLPLLGEEVVTVAFVEKSDEAK